MPIRLQVLGGLHAFRDDVPLAWVPAQHISSALLLYLTLEQHVTREQLARLFWPDEELETARHALRQALYRLRHAAGDGLIEDVAEVLRLSVPVACDALDFERAVEGSDFGAAMVFYRGAFLKDVSLSESRGFEAWVDRERARFGRLYRRACRARIEKLLGGGEVLLAMDVARAWATVEPFDDEAQHRLIELLAGSGQRAEALAQYERYERLLEGEELEPLDETKALVAMLRAGGVGNGDIMPASLPQPGLEPQITAVSPGGGIIVTETKPAPAWLKRLGERWPLAAGTLLVALVAVAFGRWLLPSAEAPRHARTAIAVLPFENVGGEDPHAYLAGALHDELITQLAKVAALSVRGRTSVMGYVGATKAIAVIADELSVGTILEGSVQVAGDRLRVNVQLIDATTDEHLWANRYDGTLDDEFAVQSDITQQIVAAVGATLSAAERTAIATPPTSDQKAWRLYLRGQDYSRMPRQSSSNRKTAQVLYERALALDSTFALAWAALSQVHGQEFWLQSNPALRAWERRESQREAAETALRLAPDLPEAHLALGLSYYYGHMDWRAALREYLVALEGAPNDAGLWARVGYVNRRLGNWDEALAAFGRVVALDPRNADVLWDLGGGTYRQLHRYREAVEWYSQALSVAPEAAQAETDRAWAWVLWQGHLDSLTARVARVRQDSSSLSYGCLTARRLLWERKPDSLLALLRSSRAPQPIFVCHNIYLPYALYSAWAHRLKGDEAAARLAFDSARALLDTLVVTSPPKDWRAHAARGLAYAGLGRAREAMLEARWLQESDAHGGIPATNIYRDDAYWGPILAEDRARILAGIGEADAALDELERLLAGPSLTSVHVLRLDPSWDRIRDHPRFRALLVKYARPKPVL